jgi:Nucleotidyl transferase AbiEii toxin, Type IV TA system
MIREAAIPELNGRYRGRARDLAYLELVQEHFLHWMLRQGLFDACVFKGGTALRKFVLGLGGRFSTDLDFGSRRIDRCRAEHAKFGGNSRALLRADGRALSSMGATSSAVRLSRSRVGTYAGTTLQRIDLAVDPSKVAQSGLDSGLRRDRLRPDHLDRRRDPVTHCRRRRSPSPRRSRSRPSCRRS